MDACQHCGTVLPTGDVGGPYCPNCGAMTAARTTVPAGVGGFAGQSGAPGLGSSQTHLTSPSGPPAEDPFEAFYRPAPGAPSPHTRTQVMPAIPPQTPPPGAEQTGHGQTRADQGYPPQPYQDPSFGPAPAAAQHTAGQPAYDQPIDYQAATDRPYSEPYEGPYAEDYQDGPAEPRSNRAATIGIGVAAAAVLVIIVSLITLGGGKSTATPQAGNSQPTEVVTPSAPKAGAPSATEPPTSAPNSPAVPVPGQLRLGDTGAEVKWLQNRLKQLNFYDGDATGTFDQATLAAVQAFQAHAHTADPSGVVARSTKTALIAAGSRPRLSLLTPGDQGGKKKGGAAGSDDVKRLQRSLAVALNQDVKATGEFDVATVSAVIQYQAAVGLGPDGIVGDRVWGALQQGKIAG
jgi:peptidoglycan hydrolase-like protein with peptidoglycan-binding domain